MNTKKNSKKPTEADEEQSGEATPKDSTKEDQEDSEKPELSNRKLYKLRRKQEFKARLKLKARQLKDSSEKSERRRLSRKKQKTENTTCFACRERGHSVKDCPQASSTTSAPALGICFRCGSGKHSLSSCKKPIPEDPSNPLPFASCFVCKTSGHLASSCPSNKAKGIYPNGGSCKVCGETSHLAKDCEIRDTDNQKDTLLVGSGMDAGADEDDFHVVSRGRKEVNEEGKAKKSKSKIKKLVGGKIIIRVDDEPAKPVARKPPPPKAKVKTVAF